jgi:hypothetical protein
VPRRRAGPVRPLAVDAVSSLNDAELQELRRARELLESDSLAMRAAELVGKPIELGFDLLPERAGASVQRATRAALERALRVALRTVPDQAPQRLGSERRHRVAVAASGAAGGFFGLAGLAVELPVTTVLILRSIARIAREEGHDLGAPDTRLACLEVFALGGPSAADDAGDTAYFAVRASLAQALGEAARHVAERGLGREGAPVLVRLVAAVAARFGVVVEEKLLLGAVPVVGAVGAAAINTAFTTHFQRRARGHFIVKRLEARHGPRAVREAWDALGEPAAERR